VANGYPLAVVGGKKEYMDYFTDPEKRKRVLIAGTYNAHPLVTAAGIATIQKLESAEFNVYEHVCHLGDILEKGLWDVFSKYDLPFTICRQGSAFCVYFMDHAPRDFHDIAVHHDFAFDKEYRLRLIENGVFYFPLALKQSSISFAHTLSDIDQTIETTKQVMYYLHEKKAVLQS
jgi:glutamate-1-semialdehyde 2,1-aminomutase